jgi:hypothetical protein
MNSIDLLTGSIVVGIVVLCIYIYVNNRENFDLKCIVSGVNGDKYCVRERTKVNDAVDLLANTTEKCKKLVKYVGKKYPEDEDVMRLVKNFNPTKISETLPTSEYTAYSENKGEKLAFCLNTTKNGDKLIDINTLMFVALHELAHIMTKSEGHKQIFWQHFKFLLTEAKEINIYTPVDYKKNPEPYCGMKITDNPLYDLA